MKHALISSEGSYSAGTQVEVLGVPDDHRMVMVRVLADRRVIDTDERNLVSLRLRTVPIRPDRPDESEGSGQESQADVDGSEGTPVQSQV